MPELPEAETIARGLRAPLRDRIVSRIRVVHPDLLEDSPGRFRRELEGRTLGPIGRRGKNLVIGARRGTDDLHRVVVNLGMSGQLLHREKDSSAPPPSHPGVWFHLDDGCQLVYHDPRRFGRVRLLDGEHYHRWSRSLGPEPLGAAFTPARLHKDLARSAAPLRSWLLDQRKVAGVGNIYANEALFLARLHPETRGLDVPGRRVAVLHSAIQDVLRDAIRARGTTLRDYRTAEGWKGSYAARLRVYGREGLPCHDCGSVIVRSVFGGRSAFHCPRCQRLPGGTPERSGNGTPPGNRVPLPSRWGCR
ncbi:MAG: bifunctional DNA-formamidopyrimidine glycosylase/DNA-(apurinic or apyrimidinic site) lyase [Gemmatimonadota bacterium]